MDKILSLFQGVRKSGKGWSARCPAHQDRRNSLSIGVGDGGRLLLKCHAGCAVADVAAAVGLSMQDLAPPDHGQFVPTAPSAKPGAEVSGNGKRRIMARYPYHDETGELLFEVVRYDPKDFRQRRPDGRGGWAWSVHGVRQVPYRLPELFASAAPAADPGRPVFIVEGEKDADRLAALELVATTNAGGAGKWRTDFAEYFHGRHVVILPDNDAPGRKHAAAVAQSLYGVAASVRIVELPALPEKGDVSNWLQAGGSAAALCQLADDTPTWSPPAERSNGQAAHRPKLVCLADVQPEPVRWLWPGRIPLGKLTLIAGDPGLGKSFLTLDVAARVSTGAAWPDAPHVATDLGSVVLLSAEDDPADTVRPRLDAAGADVRRVMALSVSSIERELAELEAAMEQNGNVRLVVIDPLTAYLGSTDSHKNAEVRGLLAPLADLAARHRAAVVAVTHLNKSAGGSVLYRATGSLAFVAAPRVTLMVAPDKDDPTRRLLLPMKNALGPAALVWAFRIVDSQVANVGRVAWESDPVQTTAEEVLSVNQPDNREQDALADATEWLLVVLGNGPVATKELQRLAKDFGHSWATVRRAKKALNIEVQREGFGPGATWHWCLPEHRCSTAAIDAHVSDVGAYGAFEHLCGAYGHGESPK